MKKYTIDQNGRSMIEMLGVLAIVGVLSVAGIAGYSKAMAKYKINKLMDQVSTIAANTKTMFASMSNYSGLTGTGLANNQRALKLGLFPEEMTKSCKGDTIAYATCVKNGMNGNVTLAPETVDSVAGKGFSVKFEGLTKDACTALMTSDWGGAAGFVSIQATVNATAGTAYTPATLASTGVYAAAKASCTGATTDNGYALTWIFY